MSNGFPMGVEAISPLPGNSEAGAGGRLDYDEPETADAVITTKQLEHTHQEKKKKKKFIY